MPVVQTRLRSLTFAETVPVFVKSACCLLCASVRSSAWCRASAVRWQSSPNFACPAFLLSSATQCNGKIKTPLYVAFHKKHIHCLVIWRTFNQLRLAIIINGFLPKKKSTAYFPHHHQLLHFISLWLSWPPLRPKWPIPYVRQCMAVGGFWGALGVQSPPNPETALFSGLESVTSIITTKTDPVFH